MNWKENINTGVWKAHYVQTLIPLINYSVDIEYSIEEIYDGVNPEYAVYANQKIFDKENKGLLFTSSDKIEVEEYCEKHCVDVTKQMIDEINQLFKQFQGNVKIFYSKLGRSIPEQNIKSQIKKIMEEYGI